jgi:hypothetical protein
MSMASEHYLKNIDEKLAVIADLLKAQVKKAQVKKAQVNSVEPKKSEGRLILEKVYPDYCGGSHSDALREMSRLVLRKVDASITGRVCYAETLQNVQHLISLIKEGLTDL